MNTHNFIARWWQWLMALLALIAVGMLAACAPPAQTASVIALTTDTPTPKLPHSATPRPTRRIVPEMLTATALARITPLPSLTPTLAPAQIYDLASPDGQWVARQSWEDLNSTDASPAEYRTLVKVFKHDGTAEWMIEDQVGHGLGYGTTRFVRWSADSRYVYFDSIWVADGGCVANAIGGNLKRLDVNDGTITPMGDGSGYAFSPDGRQMAYYRYDQTWLLVVRDTETGAERQTKLDLGKLDSSAAQPGLIAWAPDGQALAFTLAASYLCDGQFPSSVWRVDIPAIPYPRQTGAGVLSVAARVIYTSDRTVYVARWPEPRKIALSDGWYGGEFWIEAETGEIVPRLAGSWTSPNGQWTAQLWTALRPDAGQTYTQFKVFKPDGSTEWALMDKWAEAGLGSTSPYAFYWSPDGRYLYYRNAGAADGCGTPFSDLQRVDLTNGSVVQLISFAFGPMVISPDGETLAYGGLTLLDLETEQAQQVKLQVAANPDVDWETVGIAWSPNGQALMLTIAINSCGMGGETRVILRIGADTLAQTLLLQDSEQMLFAAEWPEAGRVLLKDQVGNSWWMDAETGVLLRSATPTPTP